MLRGRTGGARDELRVVTLPRYARTRPQALGMDVGVPSIAVVRAAGSISRGGGGNGIQNEDFIRQIKRIQKDPCAPPLPRRLGSARPTTQAAEMGSLQRNAIHHGIKPFSRHSPHRYLCCCVVRVCSLPGG